MPTARRRRHDGSATVEFALVLPIVLAVGLALVQVGLLVRERLLVESAVRSGARTAAVEPGDEPVRAAVLSAAPALDPGAKRRPDALRNALVGAQRDRQEQLAAIDAQTVGQQHLGVQVRRLEPGRPQRRGPLGQQRAQPGMLGMRGHLTP